MFITKIFQTTVPSPGQRPERKEPHFDTLGGIGEFLCDVSSQGQELDEEVYEEDAKNELAIRRFIFQRLDDRLSRIVEVRKLQGDFNARQMLIESVCHEVSLRFSEDEIPMRCDICQMTAESLDVCFADKGQQEASDPLGEDAFGKEWRTTLEKPVLDWSSEKVLVAIRALIVGIFASLDANHGAASAQMALAPAHRAITTNRVSLFLNAVYTVERFEVEQVERIYNDCLAKWLAGKEKVESDGEGESIRVLSRPLTPSKGIVDKVGALKRLEESLALTKVKDVEATLAAAIAEAPQAKAALEAIAAADRKRAAWGKLQTFRPILLVGPPGCGKSTAARRYHEIAKMSVMSYNVAAADPMAFTGNRSTWSEARASFVVEEMARTEVANPTIILDEIDKAASPYRGIGRIEDILLGFLEPSEASHFRDNFLEQAVDCSHVRWILTANYLELVSPALRSRCHIVHVEAPKAEHVPTLSAAMVRAIAQEQGISADWYGGGLEAAEIEAIQETWKGDLRTLRRMVERVLELRSVSWGRA